MDYSALIAKRRQRFEEVDDAIADPDLFSNPKRATELLREHRRLKQTLELWERHEAIARQLADNEALAKSDDPEFAAKWQKALREGYDNLEIEVLGHLRNPQDGPKLDVGAAVRLLAAHRATVERQRAIRSERDKRALLDSIDKFIDNMRRRRAANTTILIETQGGDDPE